jgi:hypothetical protein
LEKSRGLCPLPSLSLETRIFLPSPYCLVTSGRALANHLTSGETNTSSASTRNLFYGTLRISLI